MKSMFLAALAILSVLAVPASADDGLSAAQRKEVESIVENYLLDNPDFTDVLLMKLDERKNPQNYQSKVTTTQALAALGADPAEVIAADAVGGNPNGDVTITEWFDYQCPICKATAPVIDGLARSDGNIRIAYRNLPIMSDESRMAALVGMAIAAQGQEQFERYHMALMGTKGGLLQQYIIRAAGAAGADIKKASDAALRPELAERLDGNIDFARKMRALLTPIIIVGDKVFLGGATAEQLSDAIAAARKSKAG